DKVADRRGNLEFLQGHFAKSPLAGMVPLLVTVVTVLEIVSGALSAIGCVIIILTRDPTAAFYGAVISAISIVALFFGQRMAKDYAGAAVLVPYFLLTLIAIYLLAHSETSADRYRATAPVADEINGRRGGCPTIKVRLGSNPLHPHTPRSN